MRANLFTIFGALLFVLALTGTQPAYAATERNTLETDFPEVGARLHLLPPADQDLVRREWLEVHRRELLDRETRKDMLIFSAVLGGVLGGAFGLIGGVPGALVFSAFSAATLSALTRRWMEDEAEKRRNSFVQFAARLIDPCPPARARAIESTRATRNEEPSFDDLPQR